MRAASALQRHGAGSASASDRRRPTQTSPKPGAWLLQRQNGFSGQFRPMDEHRLHRGSPRNAPRPRRRRSAPVPRPGGCRWSARFRAKPAQKGGVAGDTYRNGEEALSSIAAWSQRKATSIQVVAGTGDLVVGPIGSSHIRCNCWPLKTRRCRSPRPMPVSMMRLLSRSGATEVEEGAEVRRRHGMCNPGWCRTSRSRPGSRPVRSMVSMRNMSRSAFPSCRSSATSFRTNRPVTGRSAH